MKILKVLVSLALVFVFIFPINVRALDVPQITAQNVLITDMETGLVAFEKNADEKVYPAGAVKMMTAILAYEKTRDLTEKITAVDKAYEGISSLSSAKIREGEIITLGDLLHALFLTSSNEAAQILALYVSPDLDSFVALMNEKASQLGMNNTKFTNVAGYFDSESYSTAKDILLLSKLMLQYPDLMTIANTYTYYIEPTNLNDKRRLLINANQSVSKVSEHYIKNLRSLKTAGGSEGGYSSIAVGERKINKRTVNILFVVLGCPKGSASAMGNVYGDLKTLTSWFYDNFKISTLVNSNEPVKEIEVKSAKKKDSVVLMTEKSLESLVPTGFSMDKLQKNVIAPESIFAPVEKGQVVGTMEVTYEGINYGSVNLVASSSLLRDDLIWYSHKLNNFFSNIWIRLITGLLLILVILYISFSVYYNSQKKKGRNVKKRIRF